MSKIYEALLRAELERANKTGSRSNGTQTAEETALANTLEPYVPEPQPQFQPQPAHSFGDAVSFSPAVQPLPLATEPPSLASRPGLPPALVPSAFAHADISLPAAVPVAVPDAAADFAAAQVAVKDQGELERQDPNLQNTHQNTHQDTRPSHDANGVRMLRWHPVLERLPALAERGQSVEQFRSLRSRLAEFRDSNVALKSVLVTSGLPQEGKSFIAANLALSLSRHRANRVLLIDADIRRSSLHAMLGAPAEPGLTEYLSGRAELGDVLQRCYTEDQEAAFHDGLSSLTFISGGGEPDKAADLSGSPRFTELLTNLGSRFDWIVVDSSPVNLVSDGVNFARACDGVLLVAREGVTKFEVAQNAQQQLKSTRILGFVLNAVHIASSKTDDYNYGPYGTYGSYGGYGYSTTKR